MSSSQQYIITISELMTAQVMISQQITFDTAALCPLANPSTNNVPALMKWAVEGFPYNYTILNMSLSPAVGNGINNPIRGNTYDYASQLLGTDLSQAVANFGSNFQGMKFSYMTLQNSVMVLVSKCD
jgi:hypothetical protein